MTGTGVAANTGTKTGEEMKILTQKQFSKLSHFAHLVNQQTALLNFVFGKYPHSSFLAIQNGQVKSISTDIKQGGHTIYSFIDLVELDHNKLNNEIENVLKEIKADEELQKYAAEVTDKQRASLLIILNSAKERGKHYTKRNSKELANQQTDQHILQSLYNQYYECLGKEKTDMYFKFKEDGKLHLTPEGVNSIGKSIILLIEGWNKSFDIGLISRIFPNELFTRRGEIESYDEETIISMIKHCLVDGENRPDKSVFLNSLATYLRTAQGIEREHLENIEKDIKEALRKYGDKIEIRLKDDLSLIMKILSQPHNNDFYSDLIGIRYTGSPEEISDQKILMTVMHDISQICTSIIDGYCTKKNITLDHGKEIELSSKGMMDTKQMSSFVDMLNKRSQELKSRNTFQSKQKKKKGLVIKDDYKRILKEIGCDEEADTALIGHLTESGKTGSNGGYRDVKGTIDITINGTPVGIECAIVDDMNENEMGSAYHGFLNVQKLLFKKAREGVRTWSGDILKLIDIQISEMGQDYRTKVKKFLGQEKYTKRVEKHKIYTTLGGDKIDIMNSFRDAQNTDRKTIQKDLLQRRFQENRIRAHVFNGQMKEYENTETLVDAIVESPEGFYLSGNNIMNNFFTHNTGKMERKTIMTEDGEEKDEEGTIIFCQGGKVYNISGKRASYIASYVVKDTSSTLTLFPNS